LLEKEVDFEHKLIDLANKPAEFETKYATVSDERSKVPLLEHNGKIIIESEVVAKYVAVNIVGKNDIDLLGDDSEVEGFLKVWQPVQLAFTNTLRAKNDDEVKVAIDSFFQSIEELENYLDPTTVFVCKSFSLAECLVAPWVHRMFLTLEHFRNIKLGNMLTPYPRTALWMTAVRDRPSVQASAIPMDKLLPSYRKFFVTYVTPGAPAASAESAL
jgi:glutathione S-transferase